MQTVAADVSGIFQSISLSIRYAASHDFCTDVKPFDVLLGGNFWGLRDRVGSVLEIETVVFSPNSPKPKSGY